MYYNFLFSVPISFNRSTELLQFNQ